MDLPLVISTGSNVQRLRGITHSSHFINKLVIIFITQIMNIKISTALILQIIGDAGFGSANFGEYPTATFISGGIVLPKAYSPAFTFIWVSSPSFLLFQPLSTSVILHSIVEYHDLGAREVHALLRRSLLYLPYAARSLII